MGLGKTIMRDNIIKYIHGHGYIVNKGILIDLKVYADSIAKMIDKGYRIEIQPKEIKDRNILYMIDMKEFVFNGIQDRIEIQPKEIKDKNILYTVDMKEFVFNGIQNRYKHYKRRVQFSRSGINR